MSTLTLGAGMLKGIASMFQLLIVYCTRINMATHVCAAYVFAYAYVIRSTRDAYCDIPLSTTMSYIKQAPRGVGNNQCS